jgi:hypothetical protein
VNHGSVDERHLWKLTCTGTPLFVQLRCGGLAIDNGFHAVSARRVTLLVSFQLTVILVCKGLIELFSIVRARPRPIQRTMTAVFILVLAVQGAPAEEFVWQHAGHTHGRLTVPSGFTVETHNYFEGIVTTLRYSDGAYIILQSGGMYRIPLFQDPEHKLLSITEQASKTVRVGRFDLPESCWRVDNFKRKVSGETVTPRDLFRLNVGYAKVPPARRAEFDRALDSFVREMEPPPKRGK